MRVKSLKSFLEKSSLVFFRSLIFKQQVLTITDDIEGSEPESRMSENVILRKANSKIFYRLKFHWQSRK